MNPPIPTRPLHRVEHVFFRFRSQRSFGFALLLAACGQADPPGSVREGEARFAVVRSDYESTAIATLDGEGEVLHPAFFSSGSRPVGLVAPLSGDVVLGSGGSSAVLNVVDRLGTDVLTRLDLETGAVLGQLRVAPGDFSTNPHDFLIIDERRGWVSRFGVNLDPGAAPSDEANDVVEVDPGTMELTGRRASASSFDGVTRVERDGGTHRVTAYARPSGLALIGRTVVLGLALQTYQFDGAAPGHVALLDIETAGLTPVALPEAARNCGSVQSIPGAEDSVLVACAGFGRPFGNEAQVRASSGIYRLRLSGEEAELVWAFEPRGETAPLAVYGVVAIGPDRFVGVAYGTFGGGGDEAFVVDARTSEARSLARVAEPFAFGTGAFDPGTGLFLLPDASPGAGLRPFLLGPDGRFVAGELRRFEDGPLPPRSVSLLGAVR